MFMADNFITIKSKLFMTISINIDHLSDDELYRIYTCLKAKFDQMEMNRVLAMDLRDRHVRIEIDTRIIFILESNRIITIKDLTACTRSTLLKIKGIGPRSLRQIERLFDTYGLELAGE